MSQNPTEAVASSSNHDVIFENALKVYKRKTGKDLTSDPLLRRLETCNSPGSILATLRGQIPDFDQPGTRNDRLANWLDPTVNLLLSFSSTIGGAVSLAYPPAGLIFTSLGSLLSVVSAGQGAMIELFERIEGLFRRLEAYNELPRTAGMVELIVRVMAEVLIILGLATREIRQGKIKRFLKKLIGRSDINDALVRLEKLAQEESRMAAAQGLKATCGVDDRMGHVINGAHLVFTSSSMPHHTVLPLGGERLRREFQQVANDVDNQKRKQLRKDLDKWLSPPDPSTN
ncbi:hypothetical protein BC826DRAFT_1175874, partial [Russula brevipes]